MNCKEFKENIANLFDTTEVDKILEQHIATCPACKQYYMEYKKTIEQLTPVNIPALPDNLLAKAKAKATLLKNKRIERWKKSAAAVIIFVLGVGFGLSNFFSADAVASNTTKLITQSAINIRNVGDFSMVLRVRTLPNENFSFFSPQSPFITHHLRVAHMGDLVKWRLEKEHGRTLVCDGVKQYLWLEGYPKGSTHSLKANVSEIFDPLIRPDLLFEYEKQVVENSSSDKYSVRTTDSTTILTINTVLKEKSLPFLTANSSISNSHNIREYVFDKKTGLLKRLRYWMKIDNEDILVLESQQIDYNTHIDLKALTYIPNQLEWTNTEEDLVIDSKRLALLQKETAIIAAERILHSIFTQNTDEAKEALTTYDTAQLLDRWKGYKIKSCDQLFHSDHYQGIYIRADVVNPNGETQKVTLALRNDNPQEIWVLDGGL